MHITLHVLFMCVSHASVYVIYACQLSGSFWFQYYIELVVSLVDSV